jgi:hypothetical protein
MKTTFARAAAATCIAFAMGGCVYDPYYPYPPPQVSPAAAFDRYWNAALGAMRDQGLQITAENRAAGAIEGRRGALKVTAQVSPQADGRYRVEFNTTGTLSEDPSLPDRVSRAYDARLGR